MDAPLYIGHPAETKTSVTAPASYHPLTHTYTRSQGRSNTAAVLKKKKKSQSASFLFINLHVVLSGMPRWVSESMTTHQKEREQVTKCSQWNHKDTRSETHCVWTHALTSLISECWVSWGRWIIAVGEVTPLSVSLSLIDPVQTQKESVWENTLTA